MVLLLTFGNGNNEEKEMKVNTNPVKGTRDFLPTDVELRDYVRETILNTYMKHGFTRIETPALEHSEILIESDGGENLKLIYKILKRGEKLNLAKEGLAENDIVDMGLRYDLTLPLSRFYANNQAKLPAPFKSIQIGEVYRAERPQRGRYRSFVQCDIDIIGDNSFGAELDLISTTAEALEKLSFRNFKIRINDRRVLKAMILGAGFPEKKVGSICITIDKIDKIGLNGVKEELINSDFGVDVIEKFIATLDTLSKDSFCLDDLTKIDVDIEVIIALKRVLSVVSAQSENYKIVFDPSLVRGMGYYTGMIFEIEYSDFGVSIAGGGRYDEMIGRFMKNSVPAVGFSIGFERIIAILEEMEFRIPNSANKTALIYDLQNDDLVSVYAFANSLREKGSSVSLIQAQKKLGKLLIRLKNEGFNTFAVYKDSEDEIVLKDIS